MSLPKKPEREKDDTRHWDDRRGRIFTSKGGWVIGEAVYHHGYSMMDDFIGQVSFFQVLIMSVTGRLPERRLADWVEAIFICMSYPDARIWCNQIGSLAGTMRASCVAGVSAGILATDSYHYGPGSLIAGAQFIVDALKKKKHGMTAEDILRQYQRHPDSKPTIIGYARPVASGDERIEAMERLSVQLGFERGEHLTLAFEIDEIMRQKFNERMNINGYGTAFFSDQGFSVEEIYRFLAVVANSGIHACYVEAADSPAGSFFPLRCQDLEYQGKAARPVPER
ncbi:MAG: hypothetical protein A2521_16010 [Deltaproteobacteria bacterium RIFOXYD12_FULL_57_12]|nr:MAG: hypothetical protein A2521_16010 [Deltaproteobacteria bacterium RIFOXYD12_FULL_57_12]